MSIWFGGFPLDDANNKGEDSLIGHLGIELVEAGDDSLKARMPPSPRLEFFSTILAEFGRALAAARRYESLRYGRGRPEGLAPAAVPRQIFEEFYAVERGL